MPPTATQLPGANARECVSKKSRSERSDPPGLLPVGVAVFAAPTLDWRELELVS